MIKVGELIAIPIEGAGFVTGHVLLNIRDGRTASMLPARSRLREHGSLLLDVYGPMTSDPDINASESLIRGIWTDDQSVRGRDRWPTIGQRAVVPQHVEFPEYVINVSAVASFERGELIYPVRALSGQLEKIQVRQPFVPSPQLWRICANLVGRADVLGSDAPLFRLDASMDLRYSPYRDDVYRALGADPKRSYWDWATAEGLDPGRFWR
jgi:hypothetical protein